MTTQSFWMPDLEKFPEMMDLHKLLIENPTFEQNGFVKSKIITQGTFIYLDSLAGEFNQHPVEIIHLGTTFDDIWRETSFIELDDDGNYESLTEECIPIKGMVQKETEKPKKARVKKPKPKKVGMEKCF